jgi:N-formylglutamate amidohydrolase
MKNLPRATVIALATLLQTPLDAQEKNVAARFLTAWEGALPVILSAPHGGRQSVPNVPPRRGLGVPQFIVERDNNTAELAEMVAGKIQERLGAKPFLVIARFERKYIDVNRSDFAAYETAAAKIYYEAYHQAIEAAAKTIYRRWNAGLLLDIHGQAAEVDTIFRGTDNGRSVTALQRRLGREALTGPKSILGQLALKGYKIEPGGAAYDRERRYTGGYTTRTYGSQRGASIDAIQLEFGTNLRARSNLERTAEDLARAIEVFAKAYPPLVETPGNVPAADRP